MNRQKLSAVVACSLNQSDLADRIKRWEELAGRAAAKVAPTDNGLRLAFDASPGVADELRSLAVLERDCCAFASWSVTEAGDHVLLDVSATTQEGIGAVQAMFDTLSRA